MVGPTSLVVILLVVQASSINVSSAHKCRSSISLVTVEQDRHANQKSSSHLEPPPLENDGAPALPNILLLISDQQRYDWDGFHPHRTGDLQLPNIARIAHEGVRFTMVYTAHPLCVPSRNALATGRRNWHKGQHNLTTIYTVLRDHGYYTMSAGRDDLNKENSRTSSAFNGKTARDFLFRKGFLDSAPTLDKESAYYPHFEAKTPRDSYGSFLAQQRHFVPSRRLSNSKRTKRRRASLSRKRVTPSARHTKQLDKSMNGQRRGQKKSLFIQLRDAYKKCRSGICPPSPLPDGLAEDAFVGASGIGLLRRHLMRKFPSDTDRKVTQPFFLQVNFPSPHPPFLVTKCVTETLKSRQFGYPQRTEEDPPENTPIGAIKQWRMNYGGLIETVDSWVGTFIEELERAKVLDETVVCFTADHGDMLGDFARWGKQTSDQGSVAVPLVCQGPTIQAGKVIHTPVLMQDLSATFLELAGVSKAAIPRSMNSRSFLSLMTQGNRVETQTVISSSIPKKWALAATLIEINIEQLKDAENDATSIQVLLNASVTTSEDSLSHEKYWIGCRVDWVGDRNKLPVVKWKRIVFLNPRTNEEINRMPSPPALSTRVGEKLAYEKTEDIFETLKIKCMKKILGEGSSPARPRPLNGTSSTALSGSAPNVKTTMPPAAALPEAPASVHQASLKMKRPPPHPHRHCCCCCHRPCHCSWALCCCRCACPAAC